MKDTVSVLKNNWKRPIMVLPVEPFTIQFEIGAYWGAILAYRKGQHGADWGEARQANELIAGLDIYRSCVGNFPRGRWLTKYEPYEQGSSAPVKTAEKIFSALIYACVMALVHGQTELRNLQIRGQRISRGGWNASLSLRIWFVLSIPIGALNFHGYPNLFGGPRWKCNQSTPSFVWHQEISEYKLFLLPIEAQKQCFSTMAAH